MIGQLKLPHFWADLQTLDGKVSPRLQIVIEKAKAKLSSAL
jgi:hypothetical protein